MFFSTVLWLGLVLSEWHAVSHHCSRYTLRSVQVWIEERVHLNMNESDPRSDVHYLGSSENKAWKKFQACTGFEPMTSVTIFLTAESTSVTEKKSSYKWWSWHLRPVSCKSSCVWGISLLCPGGYHFPPHPRLRKLYLSLPSTVENVFSGSLRKSKDSKMQWHFINFWLDEMNLSVCWKVNVE